MRENFKVDSISGGIVVKELIEMTNMPLDRLKLGESVQELTNVDLIALVLGSGSSQKGVMSLSKEVVNLLECLKNPPNIDKLMKISGLGVAKSAKILASVELSSRFLFKYQQNRIENPNDALNSFSFLKNLEHEEFVCLTLDSDHYPINTYRLTKGLVNQTPIHPREAFRKAILDNASAVMFAHNHPSGRLEASNADMLITKRLHKAGRLLGIEMLDHLIICKTGWLSIKREHSQLFIG